MRKSSSYMDFPLEEYHSRVNGLQLLLEQAKIDAIIVSEYNNFRYFAGFDRPFAGWSGYLKTRPFLCCLPKGGDPVLLVHTVFREAVSHVSWIKNIRTWSSLPFRVETIKDFLKELSFDKNVTLGFELGGEQRLGFPPQVYLDLVKSLPRVKFVDSSDILTRLRLKKSPLEIEYIRNSCKIMNQGYHNLFKVVGEGFSEKDIKFNLSKLLMVEEGEGPNFVRPSIFPKDLFRKEKFKRTLVKGDLLWIDAGSIFKGYRSDFSRIAIVGKPSQEQMKYYKLIRDITFNTISSIRPGQKVSDLVRVCNAESEKAGLPPKAAGRIGHGIGLDTAEAPSVMKDDQTVLEPGIVITIEPGHLTKCGYFVLEEIVVVTEDGYRLLTDSSPEEPFRI